MFLSVPADRLTALVARIFENAGSAPEEAAIVAANLVDSDATGHASHGVTQVEIYLRCIALGHLHPNRGVKIIRDDAPFLALDGQMGYGQRVAKEATELALARAKDSGLVLMSLGAAHHIGRVGSYGEIALEAGLAALFFVNVVSRPLQSPFGGARPRLGTNPICIALPAGKDKGPVLLDFATSAVAVNKCRVASSRGEQLAPDLLIDANGRPTQDPGVMFQDPTGSILPFGGHKGSGLALVCEILGGVLAAGLPSLPRNLKPGLIVNNVFAFFFDPGRVAANGWEGLSGEVLDYIAQTPPIDGVDRVLLPGEPERERRRRAALEGVPLSLSTAKTLARLAKERGIDSAFLEGA